MKVFIFLAIIGWGVLVNNNALAQPVLSLSPVITSGLSLPLQMVNAGDGSNRIFIVEKLGNIKVFDKSFNALGTFVSVSAVSINANERGLLSMVFHPDYINNGFFFVYYTNQDGDLELARYKVSSNPNVADAASKVIVITIPHPVNNNHNGGTLHFGSDGFLYLSTGDGGGSGDVANNAQNTGELLGKILRIAVNNSTSAPFYTIPADNPFGNEVYVYGLRNPFRWSFDKETNDLWIGDVGQDSFEEIDFRKADSIKGANFGWRCYEGNNSFNSTGCGAASNYIFPVFTYPTNSATSVAITGGKVYRGNTFIDLRGYYLASEFYSGNYFKIKRNIANNSWDTSSQKLSPGGIADFGETEDGELYAVSLTTNSVQRILSSGAIQYRFLGNGNWSNAANWSNNSIPPGSLSSGSEIVIDPAVNNECILNVAQTISPGASLIVKNNKQFRIIGNLTIQ